MCCGYFGLNFFYWLVTVFSGHYFYLKFYRNLLTKNKKTKQKQQKNEKMFAYHFVLLNYCANESFAFNFFSFSFLFYIHFSFILFLFQNRISTRLRTTHFALPFLLPSTFFHYKHFPPSPLILSPATSSW